GTIAVDGLIIDNTLNLDDVILTLPSGVTNGLLVKAVQSAGTLYGTGIAIGDLIINVGGEPISSLAAFYTYFYANYEYGDIVAIQYYDLDAMTAIYAQSLTTVNVTLK
ncbi:MAG: PDZ domain-containing protein, partial [bacterium]